MEIQVNDMHYAKREHQMEQGTFVPFPFNHVGVALLVRKPKEKMGEWASKEVTSPSKTTLPSGIAE